MAKGDTKTNQYLDIAANGTRSDFPASCCETRSQTLIREVGERIMDLEDEVERLENNPDVVDIVATYADLQSYDTSQLTDKDVIRVLQDETHDGDSTYYRWSTSTNTWTYIGESKQYTDFVGTDGTTAGTSGLVPAPATTDAGKVLGADGSWVTGGPTVVQTTGTSTTDVMSQKAVTDALNALPTGGVTELTAADYNWNSTAGDATTEPFDCVALWLLSPGQYTWKEGVAFKLLSIWTTAGTNSGNAIVWDAGNSLTGIAADYKGIGRQIRYVNASGVQSWGNNGLLSTDVYSSGDYNKVRIGYNTTSSGTRSIAIGRSASSAGSDSIAIGNSSVSSAVGGTSVAIGNEASASSLNGIAIGGKAKTTGNYGGHVSIGNGSTCRGDGASVAVGASSSTGGAYSVALGNHSITDSNAAYSVALGHDSKTTMQGEVGIGLTSRSTYGYNNSPYRLLTGLYDGQSAHDAVTVEQVNATIDAINTALSTNIPHIGA